MQLSSRVGNRVVSAFFQLQSYRDSAAPVQIFEQGTPTQLRKIFKIGNALFVGKNIADDVREAAELAGVDPEVIDKILVSDNSRDYDCANALARGPEAIVQWLDYGTPGHIPNISL